MRKIALTLIVLGWVVPAVVSADPPRRSASSSPSSPPPALGRAPTVERLPNGLTVVTLPWDSPGIVAYQTLVRVGSRDEVEEGHTGFAHLFEHMMFRGTERYPEAVYEQTIQSMGADNNAFTTNDFTHYTLTGPASQLERMVELEADRFQHLRFDEAQFRTETGAVLGEYNKSASDPSLIMDETLSGLAFTRHTYRHTTIGFLADVRAMPNYYEYAQNFFRRFYTPDACTIFVVGDVDHARVMELIRAKYGGWTGHRDQPRIPVEPEPTAGATHHVEWEGSSPPRLWLGYRIPGFESGRTTAQRAAALRETAALQIVHSLVFDSSSPLYQRLVVDQQRVMELSTYPGWFSRDPGLFQVFATLKPGESFDAIRDAIQEELAHVGAGQIAADRLAAVKSHLRYGLLMGLDTPSDVAQLLASFTAVTGDVAAVDRYVAALAEVTAEDVARVVSRYLVENRRFIVTLAPRAGAEQPSQGGAQ